MSSLQPTFDVLSHSSCPTCSLPESAMAKHAGGWRAQDVSTQPGPPRVDLASPVKTNEVSKWGGG